MKLCFDDVRKGLCQSHPTGVRGLKYQRHSETSGQGMVAPHWGAWIEIWKPPLPVGLFTVAPHWGAWIEICP